MHIGNRNATFQQWHALLGNRSRRQRSGTFLVQGVRPLTLALRHGWRIETLIAVSDRRLSEWARTTVDATSAPVVTMTAELLGELAEKPDAELVAVVALPPDDLARIPVGPDFLGIVLDRPTSPGNIGTVIRSADAFGAAGVVITGHAADPYDPQAVRASTGSLFGIPVVRVGSHQDLLARDWPVRIVGTDERGTSPIAEYDLTTPTLLVIGNETSGLSSAWARECDALVKIPISGTASSLNAANAASIALYEARRQRG